MHLFTAKSGVYGSKKDAVAIIGGAGYIGSAIASYLCRSYIIKIVDIIPPSPDLQAHFNFVRCDIRHCESLKKALTDANLVIHTAVVQIPKINEERRLGYEVNVLGTQNVCKVVDTNPHIKGMILAGSWHVFGERGLEGTIDEEFGFRPDKVEERARLYALSKVTQESITRMYDEMSDKIFMVIRMGTVLGENMPKETAACKFIDNGLSGKSITPFKHSLYRPMIYLDINDACLAFKSLTNGIIRGSIKKEGNSLARVFNLCWPESVTIGELAEMIRDSIIKQTRGRITPTIEIVDTGIPSVYSQDDKPIEVDISKAMRVLSLSSLTRPRESIDRIVRSKLWDVENFP